MHPTTGSSRKSRIVAVIAAASAAAMLLAGCSSGSNGGNEKTTITLSMQQTDVKTGDPTTWSIVQAFEKKYPNITVTVTGQPVAQHDQSITVAAQSHTLPDIFWLNNASFGRNLTKSNALLDLTPMLKATGLTDKFPKQSLDAFKQGNVQFGVPYQALVTGFYVNKKLLSDNGLHVPTTFDELLNVVTVLNAKGIVPIANGANQSAYAVWSFLTMLDRFGYDSKIDDILAGKAKYNNPDFIAYYQAIQQLQKAGAFASNVSTQTYNQAVTEYTNGKAAFLDSGVWAAAAIQQSPAGSDTVFWNGPQFSNGVGNQNIAMDVVGAPLAVSGSLKSGSAQYDAVQKFIGFYYSDAGQQIFADNGQPPVTDATPKIPAKSTVLQSVLDGVKGKATPRNQPDLYLTTAQQNVMYDSIWGVIEGQTTPQQAAASVQTALDSGN